ncbi:hypothetical protein BASA81_001601 [Batrachochytrium salamandrivorans]|nr:hypothetical protein BASA81_001601 [Batrachochytrium salamandrivorans]
MGTGRSLKSTSARAPTKPMASLLAKHGSDLLGVGILGAVGYGLFSEYQKTQSSSSNASKGLGSPLSKPSPPVDSKYSAKAYLSELATSGDESAVKALKAPEKRDFAASNASPAASGAAYTPEVFRFDLTPQGLEHSLRNILEGKKKHEQNVLQGFKRGGYPKDYEVTLRELRQDRQEVEQLLAALERQSSPKSSWWW